MIYTKNTKYQWENETERETEWRIERKIESLQQKTKVAAYKGFNGCKIASREFVDNEMICTLAINALTFAGAKLTMPVSLAIPITLGLISFRLLVYHVDTIYKRFSIQQVAYDWKPIFSDILEGEYCKADSAIETRIEKNSNNRIVFNRICSILVNQFHINNTDPIFFQILAMRVRTLKIIQLLSQDPSTKLDELTDKINFYAPNVRCECGGEDPSELIDLCQKAQKLYQSKQKLN